MAIKFVTELSGDICAAEFARQFDELMQTEFGGIGTPYVETSLAIKIYGGAWIHVKELTGPHMLSIFPVTTNGQYVYQGDTSKHGQSGVMYKRGDTHALSVVCQRARKMAKEN